MSILRFCLLWPFCLAMAYAQADAASVAIHVRAAAELAPRLQAAAERYMTLHRRASVVIVRGGSSAAARTCRVMASGSAAHVLPKARQRTAGRQKRKMDISVLA
jgi:ABC-type molybdate transport system substrate-binding protein